MGRQVFVYGQNLSLDRDLTATLPSASDLGYHPTVHVTEAGPLDSDIVSHLDFDTAVQPLHAGGHLRADRRSATATFHRAQPLTDAELVHPGLTTVAAIFSHWAERLSFHGGAVGTAAGAWAVLGARESGKSTLLAQLALRGYPILADDLVVLLGDRVAAGPPSVDLRPDAVRRLDGAVTTEWVRRGERHRLHLAGPAADAPLAGVITLEAGAAPTVTRVAPSERIPALHPHRTVRALPARPELFLDLAPLPAYRLVRPTDWEQSEAFVRAVADLVGPPTPVAARRVTARSG